MTCGIGVKPSREISARTSIISTYFLSALEVPALMPLTKLSTPNSHLRTERLSERAMRKSDCGSLLELGTLGVLTSLVGATYNLRLHIATMTVPLRLLTNLVSTTVSIRTTENTLRQVVRVGSARSLSVDTKPFNHARSGVSCLCLVSKGRGNYVPLCLSMRCFPQIGNRVRRSEHNRSLNLRPLPRVVNPITTGESDDTTTGLFQDVLKLTQLRLWSACDRENHRTVYPPLSPVIMLIPTQTFAGA
jgi:hypothetical protein